jgi:hypothetical protein
MRVVSKAFHDKLKKGATPIKYIAINSAAGTRIYSSRKLGDQFETISPLYDGEYLYDGEIEYGQGASIITREAVLKSSGNVGREIQITGAARSKSGESKRQQSLMVTLNDADSLLSKRFAMEPILGQSISMRMGFDDVPTNDHLTLYTGTVRKVTKKKTTMQIDSIEQ